MWQSLINIDKIIGNRRGRTNPIKKEARSNNMAAERVMFTILKNNMEELASTSQDKKTSKFMNIRI